MTEATNRRDDVPAQEPSVVADVASRRMAMRRLAALAAAAPMATLLFKPGQASAYD